MSEYQKYQRTAVAEMLDWHEGVDMTGVSVSAADLAAGSPKPGDKIARNPQNHADRWLVAADYFAANFAPVDRPEDATKVSATETMAADLYRIAQGVVDPRRAAWESLTAIGLPVPAPAPAAPERPAGKSRLVARDGQIVVERPAAPERAPLGYVVIEEVLVGPATGRRRICAHWLTETDPDLLAKMADIYVSNNVIRYTVEPVGAAPQGGSREALRKALAPVFALAEAACTDEACECKKQIAAARALSTEGAP